MFPGLLIDYSVFKTANSVYMFPTKDRQPRWWQKTVKAGAKDGSKDVLLEWLQQTQPDNIPSYMERPQRLQLH